MPGSKERADPTPERLLAIYLNDHLTGSNAGVELIRRIARQHRGTRVSPELERLAREIAEDRESLREIMTALDVPLMYGRAALGWAAEKAGRLKFNGTVVKRSPLSDVIELEAMRMGVEGKADCWRSLQGVATSDARVDRASVDRLLERAERQAGTLQSMRTAAADSRFAPAGPRAAAPGTARRHLRGRPA
ncbi:hypothetical protein ABZZ17_07135 [Streptomyces sp. NPDC006512]|uniref:hypothetical protein n=1 Tax=Streptomyces sp. NPDC006512 TaxID=3154307 RepID=UPI0033B3552B